VTVSVQNPSGLIWGKWIYDLIIEPETGIIGNAINGTYTSPTDLNETLFNNDTTVHKVIYRFTPRIVTDDGVQGCVGEELKITLWVHPGLRYKKEVSDYNGFNISCYGLSNGYINIEPSAELAPFTFSWNGPWPFRATTEDISGLKAGQYMMLIVDSNNCPTRDTFNLREPDKQCLIIPDAFSPNGDLVNDVWEIEPTDFYPQIEIKIYNRWGQALWKSERGYPIPWDGRSGGEELPIDSYHYVIDLNDGSNPIIGTITIIR
jgi:gliding motility-associated-like protein